MKEVSSLGIKGYQWQRDRFGGKGCHLKGLCVASYAEKCIKLPTWAAVTANGTYRK